MDNYLATAIAARPCRSRVLWINPELFPSPETGLKTPISIFQALYLNTLPRHIRVVFYINVRHVANWESMRKHAKTWNPGWVILKVLQKWMNMRKKDTLHSKRGYLWITTKSGDDILVLCSVKRHQVGNFVSSFRHAGLARKTLTLIRTGKKLCSSRAVVSSDMVANPTKSIGSGTAFPLESRIH